MKRVRPGMPPLAVQVQVAERQARQHDPAEIVDMIMRIPGKGTCLAYLLMTLFGEDGATAHLDHNPALRLRKYSPRVVQNANDAHAAGRIDGAERQRRIASAYTPNAHDPEHLIWRTEAGHKIKTHKRGDGAQHSDRVLIKKERRRENQREKKAQPRKRHVGFGQKIKASWPKGRKIESRPWRS